MKAITLTQPWASLVAVGEKRIETRSWNTNHRGPIAIHAAARMPPLARAFMAYPDIAPILHRRGILDPKAIPLGAIVAIADLVACTSFGTLTRQCLQEANELPIEGEAAVPVGPNEYLFGDYTAGRFGFVLENVREVRPAIPAKGALSLWEWEDQR